MSDKHVFINWHPDHMAEGLRKAGARARAARKSSIPDEPLGQHMVLTEAQVVRRLRNRFERSGLSFDRFGRSVGLSGEFVRSVLNGARPPSQAILTLLGVERHVTYSAIVAPGEFDHDD